jgi:flagellar motility protein MotE (MotC chaperone)
VDRVLGRRVDEAPRPPERFDVVDSLIVADLDRRELSIGASLDSLNVMRGRMTTERQELERLSTNVELVIAELKELEARMSAERDKERKSLARVFGDMDPERAADILSLLTEDDVEFLVTSMKQRQAAEILAMLSPGVAARVSERILNKTSEERAEIGP